MASARKIQSSLQGTRSICNVLFYFLFLLFSISGNRRMHNDAPVHPPLFLSFSSSSFPKTWNAELNSEHHWKMISQAFAAEMGLYCPRKNPALSWQRMFHDQLWVARLKWGNIEGEPLAKLRSMHNQRSAAPPPTHTLDTGRGTAVDTPLLMPAHDDV